MIYVSFPERTLSLVAKFVVFQLSCWSKFTRPNSKQLTVLYRHLHMLGFAQSATDNVVCCTPNVLVYVRTESPCNSDHMLPPRHSRSACKANRVHWTNIGAARRCRAANEFQGLEYQVILLIFCGYQIPLHALCFQMHYRTRHFQPKIFLNNGWGLIYSTTNLKLKLRLGALKSENPGYAFTDKAVTALACCVWSGAFSLAKFS